MAAKHESAFWRHVVIVSLLAASLAVTDFFEPAAKLGRQNPATFQLVSEMVFLAATYLVIDGLIRRREARSWSDFARVCNRTLAQEAEDVRHRVRYYLSGISPRAAIAAAEDDFAGPKLREILSSVESSASDADARLKMLLEVKEWRELTYVGIRWIKRENWALVQRVAPILLSSVDSRPLLGDFSGLHDELVELERRFEEAAQRDWADCNDAWKQDVCDQWERVISTTHLIEHNLHSSHTGLPWYSAGTNRRWWFSDHRGT